MDWPEEYPIVQCLVTKELPSLHSVKEMLTLPQPEALDAALLRGTFPTTHGHLRALSKVLFCIRPPLTHLLKDDDAEGPYSRSYRTERIQMKNVRFRHPGAKSHSR